MRMSQPTGSTNFAPAGVSAEARAKAWEEVVVFYERRLSFGWCAR